jgi:transcription antitermination protein NusB
MKTSRRDVREKAMQVLYAYEISNEPIEMLYENIIGDEFRNNKEYAEFAETLVYKTLRNINEADDIIRELSKHWDFKRLAAIDKVLIRIGIIEFLFLEDIPPKVTINECVEIGKRYSTDQSASFINGMLDAILGKLTMQGKVKKTGRGLVQ